MSQSVNESVSDGGWLAWICTAHLGASLSFVGECPVKDLPLHRQFPWHSFGVPGQKVQCSGLSKGAVCPNLVQPASHGLEALMLENPG